jgi:P4 family phage/plasmid primase-like protien
MAHVGQAAQEYRSKGIALARIKPGEKTPTDRAWTSRSAEVDEFEEGDNVGIQCGRLSDGGRPGQHLICIDLDAPEALARADEFLPPTNAIEGRPGKPRSHRYYFVTDVPPEAESTAAGATEGVPAGKRGPKLLHYAKLFDVIGTGGQVIAPPSLHPSGERRAWEGCGIENTAVLTYAELMTAIDKFAEALGARQKGAKSPKRPKKVGRSVAMVEAQPAPPAASPIETISMPTNDLVRRCSAYLRAVDSAVSGQGGHNATYRTARIIVNDFAVTDRTAALGLLREYNARLEEPWSDNELEHKLDDAMNAPADPSRPLGCKLRSRNAAPPRSWDDPAVLAESFLATHTVRFVRQTAFEYRGGAYHVVSGEWLAAQVRLHAEAAASADFDQRAARAARAAEESEDGDEPGKRRPRAVPKVTGATVSGTIDAIRARAQLPDDTELDSWLGGQSGPSVLAVENGLLDPVARVLRPHSGDWFATAKLPVRFDPAAAKPEKFLAVLDELLEGDADRIAVIQEIFGACLDRCLTLKWFAALTGRGDNGKSVVLVVLQTLLGRGNCSAVNLDELTTNRFAAFSLFGKLANVVGDQGRFESKDEGRLKTLTGGDPVQFEQKGKDPFTAVNRAKLVYACNAMPTFDDKSEATWNRMVAVPFEYTVPAAKKNPALLTPEYWADELPGILNWALEGLARLRSRGRFTRSAKCEALKARTRLDSNPARQFLTERYEFTGRKSDLMTVEELYREYANWCEAGGYRHTLTKHKFSGEVKAAFPGLPDSKPERIPSKEEQNPSNERNSTRVSRCWVGLTRAPEPVPESEAECVTDCSEPATAA